MRGLAIALATLLAACTAPTTETDAMDDRTHTLLALGDSYTVAEGIDSSGGWPAQLSEVVAVEPTIVGETGWTTGRMLTEFDRGNPAFEATYDVVVVELGVNDVYNLVPTEVFGPSLSDIISRAVALAGGDPDDVIVLTIPDYTITPFGERSGRVDSGGLATYNATLRGIVSAAGTRLVDITEPSMAVSEETGLLAPDELHYSAEMYRRWTALIAPEVEAALG